MKRLILILGLAICYFTGFSQVTGTFTDTRDGKVYKTVTIGTQTWFAENLSYQADSNCWAYKGDENNATKYGRLYNLETAKTVCPAGWHLPSDEEWTTLTDYLGGKNIAGGKMKATTDWKYDAGGNATNESGFNALPAGYRNFYGGAFSGLGTDANFWSSTPIESENAWSRNLDYDEGKVNRHDYYPTYGYSVRCSKD